MMWSEVGAAKIWEQILHLGGRSIFTPFVPCNYGCKTCLQLRWVKFHSHF